MPELIEFDSYIQLLIESLGGLKGAGVLGVVVILSQIFMASLNLKPAQPLLNKVFGGFFGLHRLTLVYGFTVVSGVSGLMMTGLDFVTAFLHSNTIAAVQVFLSQVYKQYKKLPEEKEADKLIVKN